MVWGKIICKTSKNGDFWYWQYYDRKKKKTYIRSTRKTDRKEAVRVAKVWAEEYLAQWKYDVKEERIVRKITLKDCFNEYVKSSSNRVSQKWIVQIGFQYDSYISRFFGNDQFVSNITSKLISDFANHLRVNVKLAPQTVNKVLSTLSMCLKHATVNGYIPIMPFIQRLPEQDVEHGRELNDEEIAQLFAAVSVDAPYMRIFIALCLYCGLRHSEALRVKWSDIRWDRNCIVLIQKNRTAMPAPLGKAREILESIPEPERGEYLVEYTDPLSGVKRGLSIVRKAWNSLRIRAGLPSVRVHDLRHTFATRLYRVFGLDTRLLTRHTTMAAFMKYLHIKNEELFDKVKDVF